MRNKIENILICMAILGICMVTYEGKKSYEEHSKILMLLGGFLFVFGVVGLFISLFIGTGKGI